MELAAKLVGNTQPATEGPLVQALDISAMSAA
jgi:hypothetical protein